jgi:hypothetical protein
LQEWAKARAAERCSDRRCAAAASCSGNGQVKALSCTAWWAMADPSTVKPWRSPKLTTIVSGERPDLGLDNVRNFRSAESINQATVSLAWLTTTPFDAA